MILDNQIHVERLEQSTEYRVTHGATNARVTSHFDILKEPKSQRRFRKVGNRSESTSKGRRAYNSVAEGDVELSERHRDDKGGAERNEEDFEEFLSIFGENCFERVFEVSSLLARNKEE